MGNAQGCMGGKTSAKDGDELGGVVYEEQGAPAAEPCPIEAVEAGEEPAELEKVGTSSALVVATKEKKVIERQQSVHFEMVDKNITDCLSSLGLTQYMGNFVFHQVDAETMPYLTNDDLKDMGISTIGHRRRLLQDFARMREVMA